MNRAIWLSLFLLPTMSSMAWSVVTPTITSVTVSTIAHRAVFTINGTDFQALAQPRAILHAAFWDDINPSTVSQNAAWDNNSSFAYTTSCDGLTNAKGCAYVVQNSSFSSAHAFQYVSPSPLQRVFLHMRRRVGPTIVSPNTKYFRIWRIGTLGPNDFVASTDSGGVCFNESETGDTPGITGQVGGFQGKYNSTSTWENERMIWIRTGTGTGKDSDGGITTGGTGVWDYMRNGAILQHRENVRNYQDLLRELFIGNFSDAAHINTNGTELKMASIALSTYAISVYFSTHSTYATSKVEMTYQPMILRTDTAAVVIADMTGLDPNQQLYAYVMDDSTGVNANGFAVTANAASNTNLHPSLGSITQTAITASWDNVSPNQLRVWDNDSDFASPISSGNATTPDTQGSLTCNTQYYFEVKVTTESDSGYQSTNGMTSACSAVVPGVWKANGGLKVNNVTFK